MHTTAIKTSILVLDIDGTLTDSVALHQEAFLGAMQALNLSRLDTNWGEYPQHTDTGILAEAILRDTSVPVSEHIVEAFQRDLAERFSSLLHERGVQEIPGAKVFSDALADSHWGVIFATGGIRSVSREKLEAIAIKFDENILVTSSEWPNRTQLVAAAIERAKAHYAIATPECILSIGDGRWDWEVAQQLNIRFLGVGTTPSADLLKRLGAQVIPDYTDALAKLDDFDSGKC